MIKVVVMRPQRNSTGRDRMPQRTAAARFAVVTFVLLVSLLAPFSLDFAPLLRLTQTTCGMSCCKKTGVCCCRKARPAGTKMPLWKASSRCGSDCSTLRGLPSAAAASLAARGIEVRPFLAASHLQLSAVSPRGTAENGFALFERPPPTI
jgi:hypothetical protein